MHKMFRIFNKICLESSANKKNGVAVSHFHGTAEFRSIYKNSVARHAIPQPMEKHEPY